MQIHVASLSIRRCLRALVVLLLLGIGPALALEPQVATGNSHSVYLADNGTVWCWGENTYGQVGDGSTSQRNVAVQVMRDATTALTEVIAISAGYRHTLALCADGTVWAWGDNNFYGALGNGTFSGSSSYATQVSVPAGIKIKAIAAGGFHNLALSSAGAVYAWGYNSLGSVGNGNNIHQATAVSIGLGNVREIAGGQSHSLALVADGTVRAWGYDQNGQLGNGVTTDGGSSNVPVSVSGLSGVVTIAAGNSHSLASRGSGQIAAWGANGNGQLGNSSTTGSNIPVYYFTNSRRVFAGGDHSISQQAWGGMFIWGANGSGQCGNATTTDKTSPGSNIGSYMRGMISGGGAHTLIIGANGQVWSCGNNASGQLGNGSSGVNSSSLALVTASWPVSHIAAIGSGLYTGHAVKADGSIYGWGYNYYGQIGDGTTDYQTAPVPVSVANVIKMGSAPYSNHSLALTGEGSVYSWGWNDQGQLANGTTSSTATPNPAAVSLSAIRDIATGGFHSLAVSNAGNVFAWGDDSYGQVGDDAVMDDYRTTPLQVRTSGGVVLADITAVSAGIYHSLALRADGTVWAWGYNGYGQVGTGDTANAPRAIQVGGLSNIIAISAGMYASYALDASGQVKAWGYGYGGGLGNGVDGVSYTPVTVKTGLFFALTDVTAIAGGSGYALAVSAGQIKAWGDNGNGQLGNNSTTNSLYAVTVSGLTTAARVTSGYNTSYALLANGSIQAWGYNGTASIGDGTYDGPKLVPTATRPDWLPQISLSITDSDAGEAGPNPGVFQVARTLTTAGAQSVSFNLSGTAIEGVDYSTLVHTVVIPAGQTTASVTLTPIADQVDEVVDVETAQPAVSAVGADNSYRLGATTTGIINISDNDTAGVTIVAASPSTAEADANATSHNFTVRLNSKPTASVTLAIFSSNPGEALVDCKGTSLPNDGVGSETFTTVNWSTPKTIQVFGQQDTFDDGDIGFSVQTTVTSTDGKYSGLVVADQAWTNVDDDTAGFAVASTFSNVSEAGGTASFIITLNSEPYSQVDLTLTSSDVGEGVLQAGSQAVSLNSANWNTGVTITVVGVDDALDDGDQAFNVIIAKSVSSDPAYNNKGGWTVAGTCTDDDTKGVDLSAVATTATENGATGTVNVRLTSQPIGTSSVTVTFTGDSQVTIDTNPGLAGNQSVLTFTSANWNVDQALTVLAIDDFMIEGAHVGTITGVVASGVGSDYAAGVTVNPITCAITDDDAPGFTISPATTPANRQITTESGGTATFTLQLKSQPSATATVTVKLYSNDVREGILSPAAIPLIASTTTAGDDTLRFPSTTDLSGVAVDDWVHITGAGTNQDVQSRITAVDDALDTITLAVDIGANPAAQAVVVYPRLTLTFGNGDWNVPQTVTVTGVDDNTTDATVFIAYGIVMEVDISSASRDGNYDSQVLPNQFLKNQDDDVAGVRITQTLGSTEVSEATTATVDSYSVRLNTSPSAPVTISVGSGTQCTVDKTALFFTSSNWNVDQVVTVAATADAIDEADIHTGTISHSAASSDGNYNGLSVASVDVAVSDDDTAGITVIPTAGLATSEGGATASFSVSLTSQPTTNVALPIASTAVSEGTASPSTLTFTPANWYVPQSVVITGVNDAIDDGDVVYGVTVGADANGAADPNYLNRNPPDVAVVNVDNDTAGVTITQSGGTAVIETIGAAVADTYTIVLNTRPTASVVVTIVGGSQCTVTPTTLTFTTANWSNPQAVSVTATNDNVAEGAHSGVITHSAAGGGYGSVAIANVTVSITDAEDVAGVTASAAAIVTSEAGLAGAFTLRLDTKPNSNVTILLASSDTSEGTVSPASLTFTPANFVSDQTVTVTGVNDSVDDGDISYVVSMQLVSADSSYNNLAVASKSATNTDDDAAGYLVSAISGTTSEGGGQATFSVRLTSQPSAAVSVGVASSDAGEGVTNSSSLTFDATNWSELQYVVVTGVDDSLNDELQSYTIVLSGDESTLDTTYSGGAGAAINPADVPVDNTDNDSAGVLVSSNSVATVEGGAARTFTVNLTSQPTQDVVIAVSSSLTSEATVSPAALTFSAINWNVAQTVTVTPVDDAIVDGTVAYTIVLGNAVSTDTTGYNNIAVADVSGTNADDADSAAITLTAITGPTTEAGGTATFTVVLTSQPTAAVTVNLTGIDATEGSLSASSLTFSTAAAPAANAWNTPQVVTVTGLDDSIADGNITHAITVGATSADLIYDALADQSVAVTNNDNDTVGVTIAQSGGTTTITEAGGTDTYTVVLNAQPSANVTVTIAPGSQCTVSPNPLVFTTVNWSTPRTVTVGAVDDAIAEGAHAGSIAHSASGGGYNAVVIASVAPAITDNDTAAATVSSGTVTCTEAGGSGTFTVRLATQPTANVTVVLTSNDGTEGTVSPGSLSFTAANYATPQTVTVTGVDDAYDDADVIFGITFAMLSADAVYNNLPVATKAVTCTDNDSSGFIISAISGNTSEAGAQATFSMRLTSQPTAAVTLGIASGDATEGAVNPASLTFTGSDWNVPQVVTVTGVDDALDDGDITYSIITAADGTTGDATYLNLNPANVSVANVDNDGAGVAVSTPTIATSESGAPVDFTVVLSSQPTADVVIGVSSLDTSEATVSPASLTFTAATWNLPQSVTVTPVNDALVDGAVGYTIDLAAATSVDAGYNGLLVADVAGTNADDDTPGIVVTAISGPTTEAGGTATFSVVLLSQPTAPVAIDLVGIDATEGSLSSASLTFATAVAPAVNAWNTPQIVTVTGLDDSIDDGDITHAITVSPASGDPVYVALADQTVTVTNTDNDADGVTITETAGTTVNESGGSDTYTIVLNARPQVGVVTVTVTPDAQVRVNGSGAPVVLTFDPTLSAPAADAWNQPHTVTVTAVADIFDETNPHTATITHAVGNYGSITASTVTVTVIDNDPPTITANNLLSVGRFRGPGTGLGIITPALLAATDDVTPSASLVFRLILEPGQGELLRDGIPLVNGGTFTMADITANLIAYQNGGTAQVSDGFAFRVRDAIGNESDLALFTIAVTGFNAPSVVFGSAAPIAYTENDPATLFDLSVTATDPDSVFYRSFTVDFTTNGTASDQLTIRHQGTTAGEIGLSGSNVTYGPTTIGSWSGGANGAPLIVIFNPSQAGDAEVSALLSNIQFRNSSEMPSGLTRTVSVVLQDDSLTDSAPATKDVAVTPVNDAPVLVASTLSTPANVAVTGTLNVTDADSYPLTLTVLTAPGKGTLSSGLTVGTPTTLASALSPTTFVYTPTVGQSGTDTFSVQVSDGSATSTATITVIITGGALARPWIISDPPAEAEAGAAVIYDIQLDGGDLATSPTLASQVTYALIGAGTMPAGVTFDGFTASGINATLRLTIPPGATGTIAVGIVVTIDTGGVGGQSSTFQPLTIQIVPAGSLGG